MPQANTPTAFPCTSHQLTLRHARALGAAEACIKVVHAICECYGDDDRFAELRILLSNAQAEIEAFVNGKGEAA
jgi:hypothetical protein